VDQQIMETDTQVQQRAMVEFPVQPSETAAPIDAPIDAPVGATVDKADAARSAANVVQWQSYLPENCIKTMIAMGWDVTT
jgi:hypothetical protein